MKVILLENVVGLGRAGDIKEVKDGYARNYLIPQRMAELATKTKEAHLKRMQEVLSKKAKESFDNSMQLKDTIEKEVLVIPAKAGEEGKLFGSVTTTDIAVALKEKGYDIDKRKIVAEHIKLLGEYTLKLRLDEGVSAQVKLIVVDESDHEAVAQAGKKEAPAKESVKEAEVQEEVKEEVKDETQEEEAVVSETTETVEE